MLSAAPSLHRCLLSGLLLASLCLHACSSDEQVHPEPDTSADVPPTRDYPRQPPRSIGGERPAALYVPADYDRTKAYPLVLLLHGFSASGFLQDLIFGLKDRLTEHQFLLVVPEGTKNSNGHQFWNAFPECCNFEEQTVDDVAYLTGLIEAVSEVAHVDPERVTSVGHSNGAYMSFRLACERADVVRRVVSLAGAMPLDHAACADGSPVTVLHIHGTADDTVPWGDNREGEPGAGHGIITAGADDTVAQWRARNDCAEEPDELDQLNLLSGAVELETEVSAWTSCAEESSVTFWNVQGGDHIFGTRNDEFQDRVAAFVAAP